MTISALRPLAADLDGAHLLVTGTTGFLGKVFLSLLLYRFPGVRVTLLARPTSTESALERMARIFDTSPAYRPLRARYGAELGAHLGGRVSVVEGDLCGPEPDLDLSEVDAVVHFAGLTDFQPDPVSARDINLRGALRAADWASRTPAKRLLHVSTTYVAGCVSGTVDEVLDAAVTPNGAALDLADELQRLDDACISGKRAERTETVAARAREVGWPNIYTFTKALAERALAQRDDLDLTLVRPSVVECALSYPFAGWNEGINTSGPLSWLISTPFRDMPSHARHRFDVIPVDLVAQGILLALAASLRGESERVYHLASSQQNPLTFERAVELNGLAMRRYWRTQGTTVERWVLSQLDPVPVPVAEQKPWTPKNLARWARATEDLVSRLDPYRQLPGPVYEKVGLPIEQAQAAVRGALKSARRTLDKVDTMLELYQPFIHDHDWVFRTENVRRLSERLHPEDADLGFAVNAIDWCDYWVNVEVPGLRTWSIPLLLGKAVPEDQASNPPLRLTQPDLVDEPRRASAK